MHSINHRPRRLGGPAAAVAAVLVLIVVLILTGLHSNTAKHHGKSATAATTTPTHAGGPPAAHHDHHHDHDDHRAARRVGADDGVSRTRRPTRWPRPTYSLKLAATTGECWVDVTNTTTGSVLFTMTLLAGQSHAITATGPVTVIAGAPGVFAATVNGAPVTLPPGNQAPFTLHFQTAPRRRPPG